MKKYCIVLVILVACVSLKAQYNLVPNPSFEVFDTCPHNPSKIHYAVPWMNPLTSSPDYMNACDTLFNHPFGVPSNYLGYEPARTGVAYALIATYINTSVVLGNNYREYIQVELADSLISGEDYCIRFYVSAADSSGYVTNNIGVYFSPIHIQVTCPFSCVLPYTPQFENPMTNNLNSKNGWTEVAGTYTATGGEKFIVIGNFKDSSSTIATVTGWSTGPNSIYTCYYIDDVLLTPCDSLTAIEDIAITSDKIHLYPAISRDKIEIISEHEFIMEMSIYSITGQLIDRSAINKNQKHVLIDVSHYPSNVYFTIINTNINTYYFKFIKN